MIQSFGVQERDLLALVDRLALEIQGGIRCNDIRIVKGMDFMAARDAIKELIDSAESERNSDYIGILEWAFAEQLISGWRDDALDENKRTVLERFARHPNVKIAK